MRKAAWETFSDTWNKKKVLMEATFKGQTENMEHHQVTKPHITQEINQCWLRTHSSI